MFKIGLCIAMKTDGGYSKDKSGEKGGEDKLMMGATRRR